ncbi:hypothetical protein RND71_030852 [Anisodus tanguticus]|uniref:Uncharacterized protein n=1 Tax=Anisodus tanguticus TaxID=243964 RepID=A0AAE1RFZ3_9SOLA|nr:hypothetical protein RND71_030852 [Anisodus tanguticus]
MTYHLPDYRIRCIPVVVDQTCVVRMVSVGDVVCAVVSGRWDELSRLNACIQGGLLNEDLFKGVSMKTFLAFLSYILRCEMQEFSGNIQTGRPDPADDPTRIRNSTRIKFFSDFQITNIQDIKCKNLENIQTGSTRPGLVIDPNQRFKPKIEFFPDFQITNIQDVKCKNSGKYPNWVDPTRASDPTRIRNSTRIKFFSDFQITNIQDIKCKNLENIQTGFSDNQHTRYKMQESGKYPNRVDPTRTRKSKVKFQVVDHQGQPLENATILIKQINSAFTISNVISPHILTNVGYQEWYTSRFKLIVFEKK